MDQLKAQRMETLTMKQMETRMDQRTESMKDTQRV